MGGDDDGADAGVAFWDGGEAETGEFRLEVAGVGPEGVDPSGYVFEDIEGGEAGGSDGRRMEKRPGSMAESVNEILAAADVAAENAGAVGVVDHHDGTVFFGDGDETGEGADVAIGRKYAFGVKEFAAGDTFEGGEFGFGVGAVRVAEDVGFGAGEAATVDDAGVVEFVGDDVILLQKDGGDGADVGSKTGLEDDAGLDVPEVPYAWRWCRRWCGRLRCRRRRWRRWRVP